MSLSTPSSFQCSFSASPNTHHFLILRFGYSSRLIILDQILQQTPSILMGETLIPFSNLLHPGQQQSVKFLVNEFLGSFNLHSFASARPIICHKILSFALQFHTIHGSCFKIEAKIYHVEDLIIGEQGFQETPSSPRTTGAPESAIEILRKQKFDVLNEEEEIGDCSVCYEDLKGKGKEMSKIPCGHVYHKSCILTWLQINNSCPLCRAPLQS